MIQGVRRVICCLDVGVALLGRKICNSLLCKNDSHGGSPVDGL